MTKNRFTVLQPLPTESCIEERDLMNEKYVIHPIQVGTIIRKKSNMVYGGSAEKTVFPLIIFYVEGCGHKMLIDTGGSAPDGKHWLPYERTEGEHPANALASIGVSCEDIDTVFFIHLHWDHAGNNAIFPNAELIVQRTEYEFISAEDRPGFERDLAMESHYTLVNGSINDVRPGVSVILTPGHSVGSQCIKIETNEGSVIMVGDLMPTYENLVRNVPNGGYYDLAVITESMIRIRKQGVPIFPGHDMSKFG